MLPRTARAPGGTRARPKRLTATAIDSLKPGARRYERTDPGCAGLQLRVETSGAKLWLYRFYWSGRRVRLKLGPYPRISLARARELAGDCRKALDRGIDPRRAGIVNRATKAAPVRRKPNGSETPHEYSVAHLAAEYMRLHVREYRRRPAYVQRILDVDVLPQWAERDARTIKPREVIELLDGIVARGSRVMANRVADVLAQMFLFGVHREIVESTPVQLLYKPGGKEKSRERALSDDELAAFLKNRDKVFRSRRTTHAVTVLLLTLQRRSELALAEWREFDLDNGRWKIPDGHAKAGRGHTVPLTDWTVDELRELKRLARRSRYVLPRQDRAGPAAPIQLTRSVARCRKRAAKFGIAGFTLHDLRRTGRTGLARLGVEPFTAERVVNHAIPGMGGVYDVHEYVDEKQAALELWTAHLKGLVEADP